MSALTLLIVTLMCAALAAVMTVIAWRVSRDERARGAARVAALAAAIHVDEPEAAPATRAQAPARAESRRRAFSADDLPLRTDPVSLPLRSVPVPPPAFTPAAREVFSTAAARSSASRFGSIAAVGIFAFSCLAALAVWLSPGTPTAPAGPVAIATDTPAAGPRTDPLELLALGHERVGKDLTVRGIVRNPMTSAEVDNLTAVVLVFGREGTLVETGRAPLPAPALNPGAEAPFLVTIPNIGDVSRYRVSFRREGEVVPHIDRRGNGTLARVQ